MTFARLLQETEENEGREKALRVSGKPFAELGRLWVFAI